MGLVYSRDGKKVNVTEALGEVSRINTCKDFGLIWLEQEAIEGLLPPILSLIISFWFYPLKSLEFICFSPPLSLHYFTKIEWHLVGKGLGVREDYFALPMEETKHILK